MAKAELAPFGITVNNILPGYIDTNRLRSLIGVWAQRDDTSVAEVERRMTESIPTRRIAAPDELAAVVGFLASPVASYVTGVNLPVDGGRTAPAQYLGAFLDRGPGGQHVIDQDDAFALDPVPPSRTDGKGALHVAFPRRRRFSGLRRGMTPADQQIDGDDR